MHERPPQRKPLSLKVIEAVAEARGVDPAALSPPLHSVIDLEALDAVFEDADGKVTFEYDGDAVTVDGNGTVSVESVD